MEAGLAHQTTAGDRQNLSIAEPGFSLAELVEQRQLTF
jgi:hypothetical protein